MAALSNLIIWECRTTGNANNGAGFKSGSGGTDRSLQDAAQVAIDNSTITTSITANVITFTGGYTVLAGDVGNVVKMLTGTNVTAGYYEITSVNTGAGTWTVNANVVTSGTTTNATGNMGGATDSPVTINSSVVAGNVVYIKNGTYNLSGSLSLTSGTIASGVAKPTVWVGYNATRSILNTDTGPTIASNGNALSPCITVSNYTILRNVIVDGTAGGGTAAARGITANGGDLCIVERCKVSVYTDAGIAGSSTANIINCYVTGGTSAASNGAFNHSSRCIWINCVADSNAHVGFVGAASSGGAFIGCIATGQTTSNGQGFLLNSGGTTAVILNCVAYNNASDGIKLSGSFTEAMTIRNCILVSNGGYGINSATGDNRNTSGTPAGTPFIDYNAFYNNTSGARNQIDAGAHDVSLSGVPFTNAGSNDFSLDNTASEGAACRAAGFPGALLVGGTGYLDLGALQHQDSGGAAGMLYIPSLEGI